MPPASARRTAGLNLGPEQGEAAAEAQGRLLEEFVLVLADVRLAGGEKCCEALARQPERRQRREIAPLSRIAEFFIHRSGWFRPVG